MKPNCEICEFMMKYTNGEKNYVKICSSVEPEYEDGGFYLFEVSEFNEDLCLNFKKKEVEHDD